MPPRVARTTKIEIFLKDTEVKFFDALRSDMSRPALAALLIRYGLAHADEALASHARAVMEKFNWPITKDVR